MSTSYDAVVIGAGAGGLSAARRLRAAGRSVALVESDRPGGDCTWYGCVPSKTFVETARTAHRARTSTDRGVLAQVEVDFGAVLRHVHKTVEAISEDESPQLLASQGIDLVAGRARFVAPHEVEVEGAGRLRARRVVVATGATATVPALPGLAHVPYLTNETVWALAERPEHLLVLGGGPNGCELSQAFARLGARVTLLQSGARLLPRDEPEAGAALADVLRRDGVDVQLATPAGSVARAGGTDGGGGIRLVLGGGAQVTGSHLLLAVGRTPSTAGLGLDVAGVRCDEQGRVAVDGRMRSVSAPHVYAVGDCAAVRGAARNYTHVADEQGRLAAQDLLWADRPHRLSLPRLDALPGSWDDDVVPWVTFTDPEVASVGLTEAQAYARYGEQARVAVVPLAHLDRARCTDATDGFVKLVAAPSVPRPARRVLRSNLLLRLVGMTVVAPPGGEMLAAGALAVRARTPLARLAPTISAGATGATPPAWAPRGGGGRRGGFGGRGGARRPRADAAGPARPDHQRLSHLVQRHPRRRRRVLHSVRRADRAAGPAVCISIGLGRGRGSGGGWRRRLLDSRRSARRLPAT